MFCLADAVQVPPAEGNGAELAIDGAEQLPR